MGLEAIEEIEIYAAELAAEVFGEQYAEIRVGSGALANLYAFMAVAKAGDTIIVPSPEIGGHVTHHQAGAAGLYGLNIHSSAVDAEHYTVDLDQLRSEEHTSELQSLMRISYAVFCLKKKNSITTIH